MNDFTINQYISREKKKSFFYSESNLKFTFSFYLSLKVSSVDYVLVCSLAKKKKKKMTARKKQTWKTVRECMNESKMIFRQRNKTRDTTLLKLEFQEATKKKEKKQNL